MKGQMEMMTTLPGVESPAWIGDAGVSPVGRVPQDAGDWLPEEGKRPVCAVPGCNALGKFWRKTGRPVLDGQWACGRACLVKLVEAAVLRELVDARLGAGEVSHRHRVPLGLVMIAQGSVTQAQLQHALTVQRQEGHGRIGEWLAKLHGVGEAQVTRALSAQWNCPVLVSTGFDPRRMALVMPRRLRERVGVLPLRVVAGTILYLGAEERMDPTAALALERMVGLTVESGLLPRSELAEGTARLDNCEGVECLETQVKGPTELIEMIASAVMQAQPVASRIVRLREYFWVRLWLERGAVEGGVRGRQGTLPGTGEDMLDLLYRIGVSRSA